jgi:hypothetical protein
MIVMAQPKAILAQCIYSFYNEEEKGWMIFY